MMLHDVLGVEPRPRCHCRELCKRRRGRVLGMQDDRAFEALGLSHRIPDEVVACLDDIRVDGKMRSPDFAEGDGPLITYMVRREVNRTLHRIHRSPVAERLPQVDELDGIRPKRDEHLEVSGRTDGIGHRERQAVRSFIVVHSGDRHFGVRAVRQQACSAAGLLEGLRGLDAFEARTQMDVVVEDGHASPNEGGLLGFPGSEATLRSDMDACLERVIHLLESSSSISVEVASHQRDEQTAESLPLNEPGARGPERLDLEDVLAIEDSRETQTAEPSEFSVRDDLRYGDPVHESGELLRLILDLLEAEGDRDCVQVDLRSEVGGRDDVLDLDHRILFDRDAGRLNLLRNHVDRGLDVLEALRPGAHDLPASEQERRGLRLLQPVDEPGELLRLVFGPPEGEGDRLEVEFLSQGRRGDDVLNLDFGQSYTPSRCGLESRNGVEYYRGVKE